MIIVARLLYGVSWVRVGHTSLRFICKVACRSTIINGCSITLNATSGVHHYVLHNNSTDVQGSIEAIEARLVTVNFNTVNPNLEYRYSAYALEAGVAIPSSEVSGPIPALNCEILKYQLCYAVTYICRNILYVTYICRNILYAQHIQMHVRICMCGCISLNIYMQFVFYF